MISTLKIWCSGIVILGAVYMYHADANAVSETACPLKSECSAIPNSACNTTTSKCQCNHGYKQDTTNTSICVEVPVSERNCTTSVPCTIPNSECATTKKCKCSDGYKENKATCTKVLNANCTSDAHLCDSAGNSTCAANPKICLCKSTFKEDNNVCRKEFGGECSDTKECVTNSKCDKVCTCNDGYVNSTGLCVAKSLAVTTRVEYATLTVFMLLWFVIKSV